MPPVAWCQMVQSIRLEGGFAAFAGSTTRHTGRGLRHLQDLGSGFLDSSDGVKPHANRVGLLLHLDPVASQRNPLFLTESRIVVTRDGGDSRRLVNTCH
jgi:hypothetical protein